MVCDALVFGITNFGRIFFGLGDNVSHPRSITRFLVVNSPHCLRGAYVSQTERRKNGKVKHMTTDRDVISITPQRS